MAFSSCQDILLSVLTYSHDNSIPNNVTLNNEPVSDHEVSNAFASFFNQKITNLKRGVIISNDVHNGTLKLLVGDRFFMTLSDL